MDFDVRELIPEYREQAQSLLQVLSEGLLRLESEPEDLSGIDAFMRAAHTLKGSSLALGFTEAGDVAHTLEDKIIAVQRGETTVTPELVDELLADTDRLSDLALGDEPAPAADEDEPVREAPVTKTPSVKAPSEATGRKVSGGLEEGSVRVKVEKLERLARLVDEAVLGRGRGRISAEELEELEGLARQLSRDGSLGGARELAEDLYAKLRGLRVASEEEGLDARILGGELRDSAGEIRTLPISTVFAPMPRLVRDTARDLGKEVDLEIEGGEVELDRAVLGAVTRPLGHLVRNAVDHGMELPEERERRGKDRRGRVRLVARYSGGWVDVVVEDDGGGLDVEALRAKARERGLDPALGEELIFASGFSTAKEVTEISGRGVGMDVVRSEMNAVGGMVQVASQPGRGTSFTLRLPLTMGVARAVVLRCGAETYVLPTAAVEEVIEPKAASVVGGREYLEVRGEAVPVLRLASALGIPGGGTDRTAAVVRYGARRAVVLVDALEDELEISFNGLGPLLAGTPGCGGYTILASGEVVVVLDPAYLVEKAGSGEETNGSPREEAARRILVVDDSPPTRAMLANLLRGAGFEVALAGDGEQALGMISSGGFDGVVTDVEMPEMDGVRLTSAIRAQGDLPELPVIILSARGSEEDVRRGLDTGADAYVVKRDFDPEGFLETMRRLVG